MGEEDSYFAQRIENFVEVQQYLPFRNLGYVVHALTSVVAHARILVAEASEDGWDDFFEVAGYFLDCVYQHQEDGLGLGMDDEQVPRQWKQQRAR
jgi:hypothetical protein